MIKLTKNLIQDLFNCNRNIYHELMHQPFNRITIYSNLQKQVDILKELNKKIKEKK